MPIELDGLQKWGVGSGMLADRLSGAVAGRGASAGVASRRSAPGRMGWEMAREIARCRRPHRHRRRSTSWAVPSGRRCDVDVDLGDGRRLRGTVTGLHGDRVVAVSYSSFGARHHLDAWLPCWPSGRPARHGLDGRHGGQVQGRRPARSSSRRSSRRSRSGTCVTSSHCATSGSPSRLRLPLKTGLLAHSVGRSSAGQGTGRFRPLRGGARQGPPPARSGAPRPVRRPARRAR